MRYHSIGRGAIAAPYDAHAHAQALQEARQDALRDILEQSHQQTRLVSLSNGDSTQQHSQLLRLGEAAWENAQITAVVPYADHYEIHLEYTPRTVESTLPPASHGYGQDFYYAGN